MIYVYGIYFLVMNAKPTPESILQDIAQIQRLDRGTVSVIRQGPEGAYYNHQCYENGRDVFPYGPRVKVRPPKDGITSYQRVRQLVDQYVGIIEGKTTV